MVINGLRILCNYMGDIYQMEQEQVTVLGCLKMYGSQRIADFMHLCGKWYVKEQENG